MAGLVEPWHDRPLVINDTKLGFETAGIPVTRPFRFAAVKPTGGVQTANAARPERGAEEAGQGKIPLSWDWAMNPGRTRTRGSSMGVRLRRCSDPKRHNMNISGRERLLAGRSSGLIPG